MLHPLGSLYGDYVCLEEGDRPGAWTDGLKNGAHKLKTYWIGTYCKSNCWFRVLVVGIPTTRQERHGLLILNTRQAYLTLNETRRIRRRLPNEKFEDEFPNEFDVSGLEGFFFGHVSVGF